MNDKFVVFEGVDASGKSTALEMMKAYCDNHSIEAEFFSDPGSTELGEKIRSIAKFGLEKEELSPAAELLLFSAARAQLVDLKIIPALETGKIVFCDRFILSTLVYQGYAKRSRYADSVHGLSDTFFHLKPSLNLVFDISYETYLSRKEKRDEAERNEKADRFEDNADPTYIQRVIEGYRFISRTISTYGKCRLIDANRSKDEVFADVLSAIQEIDG